MSEFFFFIKDYICPGIFEKAHSCQAMCHLSKEQSSKTSKAWAILRYGHAPASFWEVDFPELPRKQGFRYLLLSVDAFSGWVETFPCCTNKACEVVKALLKKIILHFFFPYWLRQ